jgi:hypothetical protein
MPEWLKPQDRSKRGSVAVGIMLKNIVIPRKNPAAPG